jgi:hypothetical protein
MCMHVQHVHMCAAMDHTLHILRAQLLSLAYRSWPSMCHHPLWLPTRLSQSQVSHPNLRDIGSRVIFVPNNKTYKLGINV